MLRGGDSPFVSDNGNLIYDCAVARLADPAAFAASLAAIPGVLGHGLFLGMADDVFLADDAGRVEHVRR